MKVAHQELQLIEYRDGHEQARHRLEPGNLIIGRSPRSDIMIEHADVSRCHLRVTIGTETIALEDFGSKNGVQMNDHFLEGLSYLQHGDRFRVGPVEFVLDCPHYEVRDVLHKMGESTGTRTSTARLEREELRHRSPFMPLLGLACCLGIFLGLWMFGA